MRFFSLIKTEKQRLFDASLSDFARAEIGAPFPEAPPAMPVGARRDYGGLEYAAAIMIDILDRLDYSDSGCITLL
jgi:hypothetical protein